MYSKTYNNVSFYNDERNQNTDKCVFGIVSVPNKKGEKDENGKDLYEYDRWYARFIGEAKEKALVLQDNDKITLKEWRVRNPYDKEAKRSFPVLLVYDFEIKE